MILTGVSAVTIGILDNNVSVPINLQDRSLAAAGWLMVLGGGVFIGEAVATALAIANFHSLKVVTQILVSGTLHVLSM